MIPKVCASLQKKSDIKPKQNWPLETNIVGNGVKYEKFDVHGCPPEGSAVCCTFRFLWTIFRLCRYATASITCLITLLVSLSE